MFTSYAQNFEDVILWRALKHIKNGFYIDIGAQDPVVDSVSRGFYEKGWRGVSVEPTSTYAAKLKADRIDEDIQQCAVGIGTGEIRFFEFPDTGLSTGDEEIARLHRKRGFREEVTTVKLVPLSEILDRHPDQDVHWLKIDVEGMEHSVLQSWGESSKRPWIVVVESTAPMSTTQLQSNWEYLLTERGYERCYFDGLNSFYVAAQRSELKDAFRVPPNVFDEFTLSGTSSSNMTAVLARTIEATASDLQASRNELQTTENELQATRNELQAQESALQHREQEFGELIKGLESKLENTTNALRFSEEAMRKIYSSFSWRVTGPYRFIARRARLFAGKLAVYARRLRTLPKRIMRHILAALISVVKRNPRLKAFALRAMHRHYRVLSPLMLIARSRNLPETSSPVSTPPDDCQISRYPIRSFDIVTEDYASLSREGRLALSRLSLAVRRDFGKQ
jgi:FkbM family methyltransferase